MLLFLFKLVLDLSLIALIVLTIATARNYSEIKSYGNEQRIIGGKQQRVINEVGVVCYKHDKRFSF